MQSALDEFERSVARVRHLHGLHLALQTALTAAVDLSDILRAEVVMAVSALDRYVHEVTRLGMLDCHAGIRPRTDAYNRFPVALSSVFALATDLTSATAMEAEIRSKHSFLSFQHPDKIADAFRLFTSKPIWDEIAQKLDIPAKDAKAKLGVIVDRRNKIAHEADVDPSFPGQLWPIDAQIVQGMVNDVEHLVRAMHGCCTVDQEGLEEA